MKWKTHFLWMFSISTDAPKGIIAFNSDKSVKIGRQRKVFWLPSLVHVPICMHKISIWICRIVTVFINPQFTNTSACFLPQTVRFFSIHRMVWAEAQMLIKHLILCIWHLQLESWKFPNCSSFPFVNRHVPRCFMEQKNRWKAPRFPKSLHFSNCLPFLCSKM